jgi:hypothetical protein
VDALLRSIVHFMRRRNPVYRTTFDALFQMPLQTATQFIINVKRPNLHLGIAEERILPGEEAATRQIANQMNRFLERTYRGGVAERAGNTKTYGVVRARFEVPELPPDLRVGIFAEPQEYPAWVRFSGPGPHVTDDIANNGILSIGIKLMGVEGDKLIDDEQATQDFTGISSPTFTTPNVIENLKLQRRIYDGTPALYFFSPFDPHYLDAIMQGLYAKSHASPLELQYYSCVPYLFGEGRAIQYAVKPRRTGIATVSKHPSADYLREAMVEALVGDEVVFDFMVQFQTDPHRMPVEDASVVWPQSLSPYIAVATIRIAPQEFDSPAQLAFARNLSYNPWHSIPEHRPLGNQGRARRTIYLATSKYRQAMNQDERIEPMGNEAFD